MQVGCVKFPGGKRYESVQFNDISVTRGWVGVNFPQIKHYVTIEWPVTETFIFTVTKNEMVYIPIRNYSKK